MDYLTLAVGLTLLILGASYAVEYAIAMAKRMRLHVAVFGVIVAAGTTLPELAVTVDAVFRNAPEIIVGNIMGSNIANVGLVLGVAILLGRASPNHQRLVNKNALLIVLSLLFTGLLLLGWLSWPSGLLLLGFAAGQIISLSREHENLEAPEINRKQTIIGWSILGLSLASVIVGSQMVVGSSLAIATSLGVPTSVVAVTIIAIGTSLPELIITIFAVRKRAQGLAIGNILGSNLINLALIGGIGSLFANLGVAVSPLTLGFFLLFAVLMYLLANGNLRAKRVYGGWLIALYVIFIIVEYAAA